jgi:hypothetical protein
MVERQSKSQPTWIDVKSKLADFDQAGLVDLVHDPYAAQLRQAFPFDQLPRSLLRDRDAICEEGGIACFSR